MERTSRWFGKNDKITLAMLKEIGVEGIVTALHDVPNGDFTEARHFFGGRAFDMGQVQSILATVDRELGFPYHQPGFFD